MLVRMDKHVQSCKMKSIDSWLNIHLTTLWLNSTEAAALCFIDWGRCPIPQPHTAPLWPRSTTAHIPAAPDVSKTTTRGFSGAHYQWQTGKRQEAIILLHWRVHDLCLKTQYEEQRSDISSKSGEQWSEPLGPRQNSRWIQSDSPFQMPRQQYPQPITTCNSSWHFHAIQCNSLRYGNVSLLIWFQ